MTASRQPDNRANQKRRTRQALLDAARRLLAADATPSVAEVADLAGVSRRTAYRYFPSSERLLVEAALEATRTEIEPLLDAIPEADAEARLDRLVDWIVPEALKNEALLRKMVGFSLSQRGDGAERPLRGFRRLEWLERAVEPARAQLSPAKLRQLVAALALCVGPEALLVLRDVCGLSRTHVLETSRWAARCLLRAAVAEAAPRKRTKG